MTGIEIPAPDAGTIICAVLGPLIAILLALSSYRQRNRAYYNRRMIESARPRVRAWNDPSPLDELRNAPIPAWGLEPHGAKDAPTRDPFDDFEAARANVIAGEPLLFWRVAVYRSMLRANLAMLRTTGRACKGLARSIARVYPLTVQVPLREGSPPRELRRYPSPPPLCRR